MHTDLFSIPERTVRDRYRTLVLLTYDVGWRGVGQGHPQRSVRDVRGYLRYVQFSLEAVIDGASLPEQAEPPLLDRPDGESWLPPVVSRHWGDPADMS